MITSNSWRTYESGSDTNAMAFLPSSRAKGTEVLVVQSLQDSSRRLRAVQIWRRFLRDERHRLMIGRRSESYKVDN